MKKLLCLILAFTIVLSLAACGGKDGSSAKYDQKLIGTWYVESSVINSTDKHKSMMFELMDTMYFFPGAEMEFRTNGQTVINGMIGDYSIPRPNVIETKNAQGEVTECTYELSGDKLTMNFYSNQYIVVLSKTPVSPTNTATQTPENKPVEETLNIGGVGGPENNMTMLPDPEDLLNLSPESIDLVPKN